MPPAEALPLPLTEGEARWEGVGEAPLGEGLGVAPPAPEAVPKGEPLLKAVAGAEGEGEAVPPPPPEDAVTLGEEEGDTLAAGEAV